MKETGLALAIFVLLAGLSWALREASWLLLLYGGIFLVLGGLVFSTPCAIVYHWHLYRALKPRGALDARWLWNPTGQHEKLTDEERRRVMPWFYAGAAGWGASVLGCIFAGVAAFGLR